MWAQCFFCFGPTPTLAKYQRWKDNLKLHIIDIKKLMESFQALQWKVHFGSRHFLQAIYAIFCIT